MANKKPDRPDDKGKGDLPEWLRTDEWLQDTNAPAEGHPPAAEPVGDQPTDMIELSDADLIDGPTPQSTMLFANADDAVLLTDDDLLPSGPSSSGKLTSGSSGVRLPKVEVELPPDDGDLFTPAPAAAAGPASDLIKLDDSDLFTADVPTAAAFSDPDDSVQLAEEIPTAGPASGGRLHPTSASGVRLPRAGDVIDLDGGSDRPTAGDSDVIGQPFAPTAPASGWLASGTKLDPPASSSWADLGTPPPDAGSSDIFSHAKGPGSVAPPAHTPTTYHPPAVESFQLPPENKSWHPTSDASSPLIELPPDEGDLFGDTNRPAPPQSKKLTAPTTPVHEPEWMDANLRPTDPASGWLAGASKVGKPEPSDIFTDRGGKPAGGDSAALFTGVTDSSLFKDEGGEVGDSYLFADAKPKADDGRVDLLPPGLEGTGEINLNPVSPASKTDAVNFALPDGIDLDDASGIEVLDTSGTLDGERPHGPESSPLAVDPIIEGGTEPDFADGTDELQAEFERQLHDDAGRPDFNIHPGAIGSDSNLLGDRTLADSDLIAPHSSSVNLSDPNRTGREPTADSGQLSSIFHKPDAAAAKSADKIDLDAIPLIGSSDDGTMALDPGASDVLGGRLDDPPADLEGSVFDVPMPKAESDSGLIDWSSDAAKVTDRLGDASNRQPTMERTLRTEIPTDDEEPPMTPAPKPRKAEPKRPPSRPSLSKADLDDGRPGGGRGLLLGALGLLLGAGVGAGAMFLAGGTGDGAKQPANNPDQSVALADAKAKLAAAEQEAADAKAKVADADAVKANATKMTQNAGAANDLLQESKRTAEAAAKKAEASLADFQKASAADLAAAKKKADDADAAAKQLEADKTKLLAEVQKAADDNKKLATDVQAAKAEVEAKAKDAADAKANAAAVAAKLKAADATLDPILDKLKAAKLIDDKADRAAAVAALPDAIKKANLISGDGEAGKLAKELTESRDRLQKQKAEADKLAKAADDKLAAAKADAEKQVAAAKEASTKATAELQKKVDGADARIKDEVQKAVAAADKDAKAEMKKVLDQAEVFKRDAVTALAAAKAERAADAKAFDAKLAAQREQFDKELAAAQAGVKVPVGDAATAKAEQAATAYDAGTTAYYAGRHADAEKAFAAAAKADAADARYWYFLGLSKYAQGKTADAAADFKTGADWEGRAKPGRRAVAAALERVQGPARLALETARP